MTIIKCHYTTRIEEKQEVFIMYFNYDIYYCLLIKIKEEYSDQKKTHIQKIRVKTDDKYEITFDNYPIILMSKDLEYSQYEVQKKQGHNTKEDNDNNKNEDGILDKAKEKALELKDSVVDTTKQLNNEQPK